MVHSPLSPGPAAPVVAARPVVWLVAGVRTPFARAGGPLARLDAIDLAVPVVRHMLATLTGGAPDFFVWGAVMPNLTWNNLAREVLLDAGAPATIPAFSTTMACSTSMIGALEAAGMLDEHTRTLALVGGSESLSQVPIGLVQPLADWLRALRAARGVRAKLAQLARLSPRDVRLFIPVVANRTTGKSMGEHMEITAKEWRIDRAAQDAVALASHERAVAAWERGFFAGLVIPVGDIGRDTLPRRDTSLARLAALAPVFDRTSGAGTLTAGNSSPLTDGAAGIWIATTPGLARLPESLPRVRLVDWEIAAVDFRTEGLLMAPAYAIPRLLARHGLTYADIDLWEIHEAFAAQVAAHVAALTSEAFLRERVGVTTTFGAFPTERVNPNGGSVALGHPFGATGARILSQAVQELATRPAGTRAIVSICADGGLGTVALLEAGGT
ncbi:MAG: acetyl-CoA C-acyltransferase [Burkholderiales bacterium]|nr:acetyl-CoA C-acyltransferase [Burkholderiales bacterium]